MDKSLLKNSYYIKELNDIAEHTLPWHKLQNKTMMISGATGMIGKMLIDALLYKNDREYLGIKIIALGRSTKKAKERFSEHFGRNDFEFIEANINNGILYNKKLDYVLHLASSTHPKQYSANPIETIVTNVIGLDNLLKISVDNDANRFLFASSVEVYGENRGDTEKFDEEYLGYLNCNTLRAGYPESKRVGESLCQAYRFQKNIEVVIPRFARVFGPTMLLNDSKASSQFIMNATRNENIILKSNGLQKFSYIYVKDAVIGLLLCLLSGNNGEAYNVASDGYDIELCQLAKYLAEIAGTKVVFEQPSNLEKSGYSAATKALLDNKKIKSLGFNAKSTIKNDLKNTVTILRECNLI